MSKKSPPDLGKTLQHLRKAKKLTLDQLAQSSGISKSMLSQIERGQTNPTFATLWNITHALGVEMSEILNQSGKEENTPVFIEHLQAHFTPTINSPDGKCTLKILSPMSTVAQMEWYEMRLQPGGRLESSPHGEGTVEHLSITDGELTITSGTQKQTLKTGETARYRADLPHIIENASAQETVAFLVVASAS